MTDKIIIFLISFLILFGCSDNKRDSRLIGIAEVVSESPEEALSRLDEICYDSLSTANRHYYDFLLIKVSDKCYIQHESDSLILDVIKYYSHQDKDNIYPEALYYGGRVYCDLGDYPTSLQYFQNALSCLPKNNTDLDCKANILSQTGRLLTEISLYEEAIPYIKESIKIGETLKDTVNIVYDLQLLGGTYLRAREYTLSEECFKKAIRLSHNLPVSFTAKSKMYLAAVKYEIGQLDSALNLIRNTEKQVNPLARNNALAYASKIYLYKSILDSAYFYANELIHSQNSLNRETGFQVMLSPELRSKIPIDSINQYISDYRQLLENYYDNNKSILTINQQNFYNYQTHERARRRAELFSLKLKIVIICSFFVILILTIIILYYKNRIKKHLIELHVALDNINKIKSNIEPTQCSNLNSSEDVILDKSKITPKEDTHKDNGQSHNLLGHSKDSLKESTELREHLRNELLNLHKKYPKVCLSRTIIDSSAFSGLQNRIKCNQVLSYEDPLWDQLEETIISSSPNFKKNLQLLHRADLHLLIYILHCSLNVKSILLQWLSC